MKTNLFSKVAVTMMTVALGAGVVGSISGTVAWFQYSTRSTVAFTGTSTHCTENLQVRLYDSTQTAEAGWASDLNAETIAAALKAVKGQYKAPTADAVDVTVTKATFLGQLAHGGEYKFEYDGSKWTLNKVEVDLATYGITPPASPVAGGYITVISNAWDTVRPVTSGELAEGKIAGDLYRNPLYQYPSKNSWLKANSADYVTIPLELRVKDVNGADSVSALAKNIFISKVDMAVKEVANKGDITSALRLAVRTSVDDGANWVEYGTFSKNGGAVNTYGTLDLNKDGAADTFGDFAWDKGGEVLYGYEHGEATIEITTGDALSSPSIDTDWFIAKHGTGNGTFTFTYEAGSTKSWKLNGTPVKLSEYGIKVAGTPASADAIKVTVPNTSSAHTNSAASYGLTPVTSATNKGIADDSDPYNIVGKPIGATSATKNLRVELKVYLEGWQQLGAPASSLWDAATYIGSQFNLGVRFSAEAHADH